MALIKCSECEKEFSDKAPNCPQCGAPNPNSHSDAPSSHAGSASNSSTVIINQGSGGNGLGTTGLVFAILALFLGWVPILGWVLWLMGLIFCLVGLFKAPRVTAIVGLVITLIDLIILILVLGGIAALLS